MVWPITGAEYVRKTAKSIKAVWLAKSQKSSDPCSHEIGEDMGLQPRRKKEGETVDQVAHAFDRQQRAYDSREEGRLEDQVSHRKAIESKKYQGDGEAVF